MREELLKFIVCPKCKKHFQLSGTKSEGGRVREGRLLCDCAQGFEVRNFIPRFLPDDHYASSFSFEWKRHRRTQLDSANEDTPMAGISERSFQERIDFPLEELAGKLVLDVGCGMGRFAEIVLKYGGRVVGVDLSYAVESSYHNLGKHPHAHFIQADVFRLPFSDETFDFIYSFGVLHHTPDCEKAFRQLPRLLKKGGGLSIFVYSSYNKMIVYSSNFWRSITARLPKKILYYFSFISILLYYLYKIPILGQIGKAIFVIPMWPDWRWRVLDTFDWYSPKYQSKHTHWEVFRWFKEHGLKDISIHPEEVSISGVKY